jgi:hypothetical protein
LFIRASLLSLAPASGPSLYNLLRICPHGVQDRWTENKTILEVKKIPTAVAMREEGTGRRNSRQYEELLDDGSGVSVETMLINSTIPGQRKAKRKGKGFAGAGVCWHHRDGLGALRWSGVWTVHEVADLLKLKGLGLLHYQNCPFGQKCLMWTMFSVCSLKSQR